MSDSKNTELEAKFAALRKPFPKEAVGLLPKPYDRNSAKGNCKECGKYHGLPAVHLDYVGHAAVTDRLNSVDHAWDWSPFTIDADGLPKLDRDGNLWINLTVCGITRIGVGDGSNMKERIGDAIRNAAMRFGVALDLWSKEELESHVDDPTLRNTKPTENTPTAAPQSAQENVLAVFPEAEAKYAEKNAPRAVTANGSGITPKQLAFIKANFADLGITDRSEMLGWVNERIDGLVTSSTELTMAEAKKVIDYQLAAKDEK